MGTEDNANISFGDGAQGDASFNTFRHRNKNRRFKRGTKYRKNTFKGETHEMQGNVFQTLAESGDRRQFVKTLEALERYINKKLKYPGDVKSIYETITAPLLKDPGDINDKDANNKGKLLMW